MTLDKSIKSGKDKRKPYYGSKAFDTACRNHKSCLRCQQNRQYANTKRIMISNYEVGNTHETL